MKDEDRPSNNKRAGARRVRKAKQPAPAPLEARFQAVFQNSRDAIGVSMAGIHVFVNPAYLALFGFPPGTDLAGKPVLDLIAPGCRDRINAHILRRVRGEAAPSVYETRGLRVDGSEFDMEVDVSRYQENREAHTLVILRDISKQKMAENELVERGALLQQIMDTASVAIFLVDRSGRILHANRRMAEMFGCSMEDLVGSEYVDHVHPLERETGRLKMLALLASEIPAVDLERLYWRQDGTQFWGHLAGRRFCDARGNELGLIGVITDISVRRQAEDRVRASEKKFSVIFGISPDPTTITDIGTDRIVDLNDAAARLFGRSREEAIGMSTAEIQVWEDNSERERMLREIREKVVINDRAFRFRLPAGELREGLFSSRIVKIDGKSCLLSRVHDITARKRSELALMHSEAKYRRLYNATPILLQSVDRNGIVVEVNDYWLQTLGYERSEVLGRKVTDFYTAASRSYAEEIVLPAFFQNGEARDIPYQFVKKHGDVVDVLLSATAEWDAAGNVVRSQAVIVDVTERKRIEEELRESETRFRQLVEQSPIAISIVDEAGRIEYLNKKHTEILGYVLEEVPTLDVWWGLVYPEAETGRRARAAWGGIARRIFNGEDVEPVERTVVCKDGSSKDVELRFSLTGDKIFAVFIDITQRKRMEAALKESEERFKAITITASDAILLMDDQGTLVHWNPAAERIFGYTGAEALGQDLHCFLAPQRLHKNYLEGFGNFVRTGQGPVIDRSVEMVALRKGGTEFPIEISTSAMNLGDKWHALGIVRDITERKRAEEALRENQARLDLALQSAHMGVWRREIKEDRRYFDDLTCQLLGIDAATFSGTGEEFLRAVHPEDREQVKAALARTIAQGVPYEPTYRVVWPDGSVHHIASRGRLFHDDKGQPARINGILWDITDQRILEQERIKTQKLESVGTLAGGIAHDFNNLLQGIFGYISMARLTHDQKEKSLALLEQAEKALHQSVNLTSQLLTFSKGGKPVKKVVDLRPLLENSVALALSGSRITPEIVIAPDLRAVEADEGQIGQVIQNIVLNADQAMPLGGTIRATLRNIPAAAIVPPADLQGDLVEISIRDQGTGIPSEHLARIFDPYFTTKEKGSGLGLATSYSIVRNHGGLLRVQSEVGSGTAFFIYLPATCAQAAEMHRPAFPAATRRGRILVMDDEGMIRALANEMLASLGHDVATAETGETALAAYHAAGDDGRPFDLVILDLTIRGGMGGLETLRRLLEIDPDVKAVVSSGYSEDAALASYREQGFRAVLNKPYSLAELRGVVSSLLD